MLNEILKRLANARGYDLVKSRSQKKTIYSTDLEFYETATGNYFLPKHAHSDIIVQAMINNRIFDEPIVNLAEQYIKKGTTVLDVGSNFGQMAILFSEMTGDDGHVYGFDADEFVYSALEKNVKANNKSNITLNFGAVHNKDNETLYFPMQDFERFGTFGSYGIDYKNNRGRPVKTLTIDSLKISTPISFMKVDVQGGDLFALQGAKKTIAKNKMPIIFEYEYLFEEELNFNFQQYVDFVNEINYQFVRVINGQNFLIVPK